MKSQVNFVYDIEDDPTDEIKHWLFLENVRLQQVRQELAEERKKLDSEKKAVEHNANSHKMALEAQEKKLIRQKELFEKQWQLLENELRRLARDKANMEREKENIKNLQAQVKSSGVRTEGGFFAGVNSAATLKKRYRDLLKIYHPDNANGDSGTVHTINLEYKNLKKQYGID